MKYKNRTYPLFSACGLNCGLCPRYHTNGSSKCPGCAGVGFSLVHPSCGVLSCCQRKEMEYCFLCEEYPCKKYDGADSFDSFITHKNQFCDMEKAKQSGIETYQIELDEKMQILESLLRHYDDGRRKNFYCVAVNVLPLQDIKAAIQQIDCKIDWEMSLKERAAAVVRLFEEIAKKQKISLRLRKRTNTIG